LITNKQELQKRIYPNSFLWW